MLIYVGMNPSKNEQIIICETRSIVLRHLRRPNTPPYNRQFVERSFSGQCRIVILFDSNQANELEDVLMNLITLAVLAAFSVGTQCMVENEPDTVSR